MQNAYSLSINFGFRLMHIIRTISVEQTKQNQNLKHNETAVLIYHGKHSLSISLPQYLIERDAYKKSIKCFLSQYFPAACCSEVCKKVCRPQAVIQF